LDANEIKALDQEYILGTYGRNPIVLEKGSNATCWDAEGKKYIDMTAGIGVNSLGFSDYGWAEAVAAQALSLQHISNLYYTEPCVRLAEQLVKRTGLSRVFFGNSGAEANEGAMKCARKYSVLKYGEGRSKIVTLVNSFHGRTLSTVTATGQDVFHKWFGPFPEGHAYAEAGNLDDVKAKAEGACAVMMELVQGEGGVMALDPQFVKDVETFCKENDILLIIDEVQTGIGRTGSLFCFQQFGIQPDIVTVAKGLGGGLPIGAFIVGEKCKDAMTAGDHGSTFGGNPVACAGANYVLSCMTDKLFDSVKKKGALIREALLQIPEVAGVSGMGLMIGIELKTKKAADIVAACREQGLLVLTAKTRVRLLPPLTISDEELQEGLAILLDVLKN